MPDNARQSDNAGQSGNPTLPVSRNPTMSDKHSRRTVRVTTLVTHPKPASHVIHAHHYDFQMRQESQNLH
eukprot:5518652-Prymnesium_polylepis.1